MSIANTKTANESAPSAESIFPEDMGLEEIMRVMDVATTLRREQELVEREFNLEKTKQMLRDKLIRTAELTGEDLTPDQVEAAVNWYYDNLHEYKEPEPSLKLYLAHLYIRRKKILLVLLPLLLVATSIWALWFAPFAPFSETNRLQRDLSAVNNQIEKQIKSIRAVADDGSIESKVDKLETEAKVHYSNSDSKKLGELAERLDNTYSRINEEFTITVVSGDGKKSGIDRYYGDDDNKNISGYYLIVEARTDDGKVLKRNIHDIETDRVVTVSKWAEKVPKAVYDRLLADKKDDGILNETAFGKKNRGQLKIDMIIPGEDGLPIQRSGQITQW